MSELDEKQVCIIKSEGLREVEKKGKRILSVSKRISCGRLVSYKADG